METPSQDLISCKGCGQVGTRHKAHRLFCEPCARKKQVDYQRAYRSRVKAVPRLVPCKGCGETFDASTMGRTWRCQECTRQYNAQRRAKDRERHAGYSRNYRARLGDEYNARLAQRRRDLIAQMTAEELAAFRKAESSKTSRLVNALRDEVFAAYGGYRCACCGETERHFLSIDHINNDGAELRRSGRQPSAGTGLYQWLKKNGFPSGYQVLCMNCNVGKHRNGGVCPHQSGKA